MKCIVCNSEENIVFDTNQLDGYECNLYPTPKGMDVLRCANCGLFFFDPSPTRKQLRSYHGKQYFVCHNPLKQTGYPNYIDTEHLRVKEEWGQRLLNWFMSFDGSKVLPKRILDIGCATGTMLNGMRKCSKIQAVGVDISEWAIEWGRSHYKNIELHCGRLPECHIEGPTPTPPRRGQFDYVLFWDSIEHDDNIHEVLECVSRLMKPGGLMIIQTPDGTMAKRDWYYWSPHQHVCIFNEYNLGMLLKQHGFEIIKKRLSSEPDEIVLLAKSGE
jgi:2-polyprenyl-3-methyl-5-hydroxy-6-metoxy-1,4-benzoquinol methylase